MAVGRNTGAKVQFLSTGVKRNPKGFTTFPHLHGLTQPCALLHFMEFLSRKSFWPAAILQPWLHREFFQFYASLRVANFRAEQRKMVAYYFSVKWSNVARFPHYAGMRTKWLFVTFIFFSQVSRDFCWQIVPLEYLVPEEHLDINSCIFLIITKFWCPLDVK